MIIYQFQTCDPIIDQATENVIGWALGLRGTDSDDPVLTAYIDAEAPVPVDNLKPQANWSPDEIQQFAMKYALKEEYIVDSDTGTKEYTKQNWYMVIRQQVEAMKGQPIRGSRIVI